MNSLIKIFVLALALGMIITAIAEACSEPERPPRRPWLVSIEPLEKGERGATLVMEITGPVESTGASFNNSCGIVAQLPSGMEVKFVDIVNANDGSNVGFGKFEPNQKAMEATCIPHQDYSCAAFTALVGKTGVPKGIPFKFVLHLSTGESKIDVKNNISRTAQKINSEIELYAGQFNKDGTPGDHFLVMSPSLVEVNFGHH